MTDTAILKNWKKLSTKPLGSWIFSTAYWTKAPYFWTSLPKIKELENGKAVLHSPLWFGVHNHIGTFHAIAACNLAEAAMGMLLEASLPTTHQWIPKGMEVKYLGKAETGLTATATFQDKSLVLSEITTGTDVFVEIPLVDKNGTEVYRMVINTWVRPKSKK